MELRRELAEIDQFLALYRRYSGTDREDHGTHNNSNAVENSESPAIEGGPRKQRGRPADFGRIMEGVLKDIRRPLQRGEFVVEVEDRGYTIPSEDKARYLGTILWRQRDRFVNIPDVGYWLKNEPCEAVAYIPGDVVDERVGETEETATGLFRDSKAFIR
jgi:hypothetical protein